MTIELYNTLYNPKETLKVDTAASVNPESKAPIYAATTDEGTLPKPDAKPDRRVSRPAKDAS